MRIGLQQSRPLASSEIQYRGLGASRAGDGQGHLQPGGSPTHPPLAGAAGQEWRPLEVRTIQRPVTATRILDAWPNPFNPTIYLRVLQAETAQVSVAVHDILGRRVRELHTGSLPAGQTDLAWDGLESSGEPAASGVYFLRYESGATVENSKVVLLR